jgi:hypothetical protein
MYQANASLLSIRRPVAVILITRSDVRKPGPKLAEAKVMAARVGGSRVRALRDYSRIRV